MNFFKKSSDLCNFIIFFGIVLLGSGLLLPSSGKASPENEIAQLTSGDNFSPSSQTLKQDFNPDLTNLTLGNYCLFLNQVAGDDPHGLYNEQMADGFEGGAIIREGGPGNYNYHVEGNGVLPISNVSCLDILRYCNWIENGGNSIFENPQITEEGSYQIGVPQCGEIGLGRELEAKQQESLLKENPNSTFIVVDLDHPDQDLCKELALDPSDLYLASNQPSRYVVIAREDLGALPQSVATRQAIQPQRVGWGQGMEGLLLGVGMMKGGMKGEMTAETGGKEKIISEKEQELRSVSQRSLMSKEGLMSEEELVEPWQLSSEELIAQIEKKYSQCSLNIRNLDSSSGKNTNENEIRIAWENALEKYQEGESALQKKGGKEISYKDGLDPGSDEATLGIKISRLYLKLGNLQMEKARRLSECISVVDQEIEKKIEESFLNALEKYRSAKGYKRNTRSYFIKDAEIHEKVGRFLEYNRKLKILLFRRSDVSPEEPNISPKKFREMIIGNGTTSESYIKGLENDIIRREYFFKKPYSTVYLEKVFQSLEACKSLIFLIKNNISLEEYLDCRKESSRDSKRNNEEVSSSDSPPFTLSDYSPSYELKDIKDLIDLYISAFQGKITNGVEASIRLQEEIDNVRKKQGDSLTEEGRKLLDDSFCLGGDFYEAISFLEEELKAFPTSEEENLDSYFRNLFLAIEATQDSASEFATKIKEVRTSFSTDPGQKKGWDDPLNAIEDIYQDSWLGNIKETLQNYFCGGVSGRKLFAQSDLENRKNEVKKFVDKAEKLLYGERDGSLSATDIGLMIYGSSTEKLDQLKFLIKQLKKNIFYQNIAFAKINKVLEDNLGSSGMTKASKNAVFVNFSKKSEDLEKSLILTAQFFNDNNHTRKYLRSTGKKNIEKVLKEIGLLKASYEK